MEPNGVLGNLPRRGEEDGRTDDDDEEEEEEEVELEEGEVKEEEDDDLEYLWNKVLRCTQGPY